MINYYPPKFDIAQIVRRYPELEMVNEEEQTRLDDIEFKKKRGKGAPKKARSKGLLLLFTLPSQVLRIVKASRGELARSGDFHRFSSYILHVPFIYH